MAVKRMIEDKYTRYPVSDCTEVKEHDYHININTPYIAKYRKKHPQKVQRWRFNASLANVLRYLNEHPEVAKELNITIIQRKNGGRK